jgi:hypothetical protein
MPEGRAGGKAEIVPEKGAVLVRAACSSTIPFIGFAAGHLSAYEVHPSLREKARDANPAWLASMMRCRIGRAADNEGYPDADI